MNLRINDEMVNVPQTLGTITDLIRHLELSNPFIIVEHNHVILKTDEHANVTINDGDKIELVQFVGGG